jgi:hypothetical protein
MKSLDISNSNSDNSLFQEISHLILESIKQVVAQANSAVTLLFWQVGYRINSEILQNKRADYGKQVVSQLALQLEKDYGRNFTEKNLRRMMQFAKNLVIFKLSLHCHDN